MSLYTKDIPIVDSAFVPSSAKEDKVCDKIRAFFHDKLDIREYGPKIKVEKLLKTYDDGIEVNEQYFKDLLVFAKYQANHDDIDFSASSIVAKLKPSTT